MSAHPSQKALFCDATNEIPTYSLANMYKRMHGGVSMSKLENLYMNARRAKADKDYETAINYYEMILQMDATSWEAAFYSVYLKATKTELSEKAEAVVDVINCLDQVLNLIKEYIYDRNEQIDAVKEISSCCSELSSLAFTFNKAVFLKNEINNLWDSINEVPNKKSNQDAVKEQLLDRCNISWVLEYSLGDKIENEFGEYVELHVIVTDAWKAGVEIQNELMEYVTNKQEQMDIINRTIEKIHKYDPSYALPKRSKEQQKTEQSSGGCYIATCVYGSYDCPQVWTLRRFRDYTLDTTWYGRLFIRCYYAISPKLVRIFGKKAWFKRLWKKRLDNMVLSLHAKGVKDTPYCDKNTSGL